MPSNLCFVDSLTLPGHCESDAYDFLNSLDSGGIGGGAAMMHMGHTVPQIRDAYYAELMKTESMLPIKQSTLSPDALNRWKIEERIRIAKLLRNKQGLLPSVILELRDRQVYGAGGRTVDNLIGRTIQGAANKGVALDRNAALAKLGSSWNSPNHEVTKAAQAARYLKYGGRVFFVVGIGASAHAIVTAPEQERIKVAAQEGAGIAGGALGSAVAVGLVIGFGIVTGGWGLIAIGLVGGLAGGAAAEYGTHRLLYAHQSQTVEQKLNGAGFVHRDAFTARIPAH